MFTHKIPAFAVILVLGLAIAACSFGPPPSCGENIGGTADTAKFEQYFTSMSLISDTTGQPGPEGENGMKFPQGEPLSIQVDAKSEVAVYACIQPMSGGDSIAFDQTKALASGPGAISIGTLEAGNYVIRVIVYETLVKNFPFAVK